MKSKREHDRREEQQEIIKRQGYSRGVTTKRDSKCNKQKETESNMKNHGEVIKHHKKE